MVNEINSNDKVIRDLAHGYITLDEFFQKLVDNKHFQRLRYIKQLTCQHVYPSANHTRFEHSLGVYYLSRRYFKAIKRQLIESGDVDEKSFENMLFNLSVAALLHDVGHAPLSHLGEKYFNVRKIKKAFEVECDSRNIAYKDICACKGAAPHELMSCYIIVKYFYNIILQEKAKEYDVDFELICRMIVGATYNTDSKWFEDLAIGVLNSSTIDMDKLDYIIRDPLMTGISVPRIDVTRFFRGLKYKKETHKVVILKQAITVVQNIIDTRDCLYLLVCNHHVTVYTDFIIEFYIKHLMLMHDKGQLAITEDSLAANDYFSCDAIGEKLVTDGDLLCKLKEYYNKNKNFSPYTQVITPQIFERKFLAPLWKDLYSFNMFQEKYIGDTYKIEDMLKKMCDNEDYIYRRYIAREINNKLKLTHGNIFIVPRSNKFYMDNPNNKFYIYVNDCLKKISELLPQKYYGNLHSGAAFYVYGPKEHINEVREAFVEVIKRGLPSKDKIDYPESIPNWLKDSEDD